ncbi:MAG: cytochrome c oxidase accessory protein CcoG [Aquabacterium sp.]
MAAAPDGDAAVVSLYQKSPTIYPRAVSGWFAAWRWLLVWGTQLAFYGLPWLQWNGRPALAFDLTARRFYIFDLVLYPQDFIFLTALLLISAYALFLFTAVAGRLWCGYACPQTVYTEIFLWIERKVEGDRTARMRLDKSPLSAAKLLRKTAKHGAWMALALWTGFTFVGYFTPIRSLAASVAAFTLGPWEWFWILFYGLATYGNAGWLREQVCKYMCPYARFQGAMFDHDTLIVSYDTARGEPRGARSRQTDHRAKGLGDCVDCTLCVQVCPTGIDIRKGLQYECIGCGACIDVCNGVMDKVGYPRGLIRYATQNALTRGWTPREMWARVARPRVLIYSAILLLIVVTFLWGLTNRLPFRADVVRDRASLARIVDDGWIENVYRIQVMNATERPQRYRISVQGLEGARLTTGSEVQLDPAAARWTTVSVRLPPEAASQAGPGARPLQFVIAVVAEAGAAGAQVSEKSTFVIPR